MKNIYRTALLYLMDLTVSSGREVTLADRPYIDAVYQVSKSHEYSLRAAIEAIVAHPEFGRK